MKNPNSIILTIVSIMKVKWIPMIFFNFFSAVAAILSFKNLHKMVIQEPIINIQMAIVIAMNKVNNNNNNSSNNSTDLAQLNKNLCHFYKCCLYFYLFFQAWLWISGEKNRPMLWENPTITVFINRLLFLKCLIMWAQGFKIKLERNKDF